MEGASSPKGGSPEPAGRLHEARREARPRGMTAAARGVTHARNRTRLTHDVDPSARVRKDAGGCVLWSRRRWHQESLHLLRLELREPPRVGPSVSERGRAGEVPREGVERAGGHWLARVEPVGDVD